MADQISKIVTDLPKLESTTDIWHEVEARLAQGDAAFSADLGIALAKAYRPVAGTLWQYHSVFDHLLRLLAITSGSDNIVQAIRLVTAPEVNNQKLDRYTASLLAASHQAKHLVVAFTENASAELRACLVHELILRGVILEEVPEIAMWTALPQWSHHRLGWLPLTLSDIEVSQIFQATTSPAALTQAHLVHWIAAK